VFTLKGELLFEKKEYIFVFHTTIHAIFIIVIVLKLNNNKKNFTVLDLPCLFHWINFLSPGAACRILESGIFHANFFLLNPFIFSLIVNSQLYSLRAMFLYEKLEMSYNVCVWKFGSLVWKGCLLEVVILACMSSFSCLEFFLQIWIKRGLDWKENHKMLRHIKKTIFTWDFGPSHYHTYCLTSIR